jgi:glycerophosphoryl diester phosphodiesterase
MQPTSSKDFDTQGHRGCRGLMPENTIPAMVKALDIGVHTLELDIVFTKDKKAVLSHEPFFNHEISTKPGGEWVRADEEKSLNIYQMTYDELKEYDVGSRPHPRFPGQQKFHATKPLLEDMLDSVKLHVQQSGRPMPDFNIETKTSPLTDNVYHPAPEEFVDRLMEVVNRKGIADRTIIQSFDFRTLQYLHKKFPAIRTAMLIEDFDKRSLSQQVDALGFVPTIYSPAYSLVNDSLVKACHDRGIKIIPWTVNDRLTIDKLAAMGVDGIISDFPNLFFNRDATH